MPTNVPAIIFGDTGPVSPDEQAILAGIQADLNAAFGGNLAFGNGAPETQLANSETAIVGDANDQFMALFNNVDPAYSSGRMQDAIGRIYFLERITAQATLVQVNCNGLTGVIIPVGALLIDNDTGYRYQCTQSGTITAGGTIQLPFANTVAGPYAVPSTLTIYQSINGWDSATVAGGTEGRAVESRTAFETRRQASVAGNAQNQLASIRAQVLAVANVLSCYTNENPNEYPIAFNPVATATASISGTTLTTSGTITGTIANGQTVAGVGVTPGTTIVSGAGTTWTVSASQTVASTPISFGGVVIPPHKIYVCVYGGDSTQVCTAIFSKKGPGAGYVGDTTNIIYDTSPPYPAPGVPYQVTYQAAAAFNVFVLVKLVNNSNIPADAQQQIAAAIIDNFSGNGEEDAPQIGFPVLASRFYCSIAALGSWAKVFSITLSSSTTAANAVVTGSIAGTTLTVTAVSSGTLAVNQKLAWTGGPGGIFITALGSGTGGTGTYTINTGQTVSSTSIQARNLDLDIIPVAVNQFPQIFERNILLVLV